MRLDHCVQRWLEWASAPNRSLKEAQRRVRAGEFTISGRIETNPKVQFVPLAEPVARLVDPSREPNATDGGAARIEVDEHHAFYVMHKPAGVVCQRHPREPDVYSLVPAGTRYRDELGCVGRLDRDTTGALLFCTDGGVQSLLLHPSSRVWKTYAAELSDASALDDDAVARFAGGLTLDDDGTRCAPASLEVLSASAPLRVRVTLHEGFFHQVKRMLRQVGGEVVQLHRERVGFLDADSLQPGEMRQLTLDELRRLGDEMLPVDRVAKRDDALLNRRAAVAAEPHERGADADGGRRADEDGGDPRDGDPRPAKLRRAAEPTHGEAEG